MLRVSRVNRVSRLGSGLRTAKTDKRETNTSFEDKTITKDKAHKKDRLD